jgi:hypothetical protein
MGKINVAAKNDIRKVYSRAAHSEDEDDNYDK